MAVNPYRDHRDEVASGMVETAIDKLKNGTSKPLSRGTDHSKPSLVPPLLPPSKINKPSAWPKRIHIPLPD